MSRVELGGFGEPIPLEALPDLTDLGDAITLVMTDGEDFHAADFIALGYTHYEVMCVGGAGGLGGKSTFGVGLYASGYNIYTQGGAGGGGGYEVVSGALVDLPESCAVVVGAAGVDGVDGGFVYSTYYDGVLVPGAPGTDGGPSSFGDTICRASGGKGGASPPGTNTNDANQGIREANIEGIGWVREPRAGGDGGEGGIGGRIEVGGGAVGGTSIAGSWSPYPGAIRTAQLFYEAQSGSWDGHIGVGGGGGRGGTFAWFSPPIIMYSV